MIILSEIKACEHLACTATMAFPLHIFSLYGLMNSMLSYEFRHALLVFFYMRSIKYLQPITM